MASSGKSAAAALRVAIQTEEDGIAMYERAVEQTKHPFAKKLFRGLAEDEKSHVQMIESIAQGMGMSAALNLSREGTPKERIKTIFSESHAELADRIDATADELEVLRAAIEFEQNGYGYYKAAAAEAESEDARSLFEKLALEENEHYEVLSSTYEYLDQAGQWFLWDEGALLEG